MKHLPLNFLSYYSDCFLLLRISLDVLVKYFPRVKCNTWYLRHDTKTFAKMDCSAKCTIHLLSLLVLHLNNLIGLRRTSVREVMWDSMLFTKFPNCTLCSNLLPWLAWIKAQIGFSNLFPKILNLLKLWWTKQINMK